MRLLARGVCYWLYGVWIGLRFLRGYSLGVRVILDDGRTATLVNGVARPLWSLVTDDEEYHEYVHERRFRKVISIGNYVHAFVAGRRWWMSSWYAIARDGHL